MCNIIQCPWWDDYKKFEKVKNIENTIKEFVELKTVVKNMAKQILVLREEVKNLKEQKVEVEKREVKKSKKSKKNKKSEEVKKLKKDALAIKEMLNGRQINI